MITSPLMAQEEYEYKPQFQKVAYSRTVPESILRLAKNKRSTRFYGSFKMDKQTYALHLYDTGSVQKSEDAFYKRNCCLDVFQQAGNKTWQRIHTLPFSCEIEVRRDRLTVQVEKLWLDPATKTVPMIYLKIMERDGREEIPIGNQTYIYGVLQGKTTAKAFQIFNCYMPYSNITITSSDVSFPDTNGRLTLIHTTSDPGETSYGVYGWSGDSWKLIASLTSQNGYETAKVWNGTEFVPLASMNKKP